MLLLRSYCSLLGDGIIMRPTPVNASGRYCWMDNCTRQVAVVLPCALPQFSAPEVTFCAISSFQIIVLLMCVRDWQVMCVRDWQSPANDGIAVC